MQVLNKVLFRVKGKAVKVRELVILIMILVLLLLLYRCENQKKEEDKKREDAISDVCGVSKSNINELENLLSRSDLCSDDWYNDLEDYVSRLKDQNKVLKAKKGEKNENLYKLQNNIIEALESFVQQQDVKAVNKLQDKVKEYKKYYDKNCEGEGNRDVKKTK